MYEDVTSESVKAGENVLKEAVDGPIFVDERHSVMEYSISVEECSSITRLRQKLKSFLENLKNDNSVDNWNDRVKVRRFLFCPKENTWHVIVALNTENLSQERLGAYFDYTQSIGFDTAKWMGTVRGDRFAENEAEAQGCIRVIDQYFNEDKWKEYNLERVAKYLATHIH